MVAQPKSESDGWAFYAGFLEYLRREEFDIGVDDHLAVAELLTTDHAWTRGQLKTAMRAVLVRVAEDEATYDRAFETWFGSGVVDEGPSSEARSEGGEAPAAPTPHQPQAPERRRPRPLLILAATTAIIGLVLWAIAREPPRPPVEPDEDASTQVDSLVVPETTSIDPEQRDRSLEGVAIAREDPEQAGQRGGGGPGPTGVREDDSQEGPLEMPLPLGEDQAATEEPSEATVETPSSTVPMAVSSPPRWGSEPSGALRYGGLRSRGGSLLTAALLLAVLIWFVVWPLRRTLRRRTEARSLPPGPLRFGFHPQISSMPTILGAQQIEDLASSLGVAATMAPSRALDIQATILATAASAGAPHLVHRVRTTPRRYGLALQEHRGVAALTRVVTGIGAQLVAAGVELQSYRFDLDPTALVDAQGGRHSLLELLDSGLDGVLFVGSPDTALAAEAERPATWTRTLPPALARVWLAPPGAKRRSIGWQLLEQVGIHVFDDPLRAISALGSFSIDSAGGADGQSRVRFRQAAAWLPDWNALGLEWLADRFFAELPPAQRAELLALPAPDPEALRELRELCPERLGRKVRAQLMREMERLRPARGTGAEIRWRVHRAGLLAWDVPELAEIDLLELGSREPWAVRLASVAEGLQTAEGAADRSLRSAIRRLREPLRLPVVARLLLAAMLTGLMAIALVGLAWLVFPAPGSGHRWDLQAGSHGLAAARADGRLAATATSAGLLRVWEPGSGELLTSRGLDGASPTALALSPDGALLALGSAPPEVEFFTQASLQPLSSHVLPAPSEGVMEGSITHLVFSPDSWLLAVGTASGRIVLLDTVTTESLADVWVGSAVAGVLWEPDSRSVLVGTEQGSIQEVTLDGEATEITKLPTTLGTLVEVGPGLDLVATGGGGDWYLVARDGGLLATVPGLVGGLASIATWPGPNLQVATGNLQGVIGVWTWDPAAQEFNHRATLRRPWALHGEPVSARHAGWVTSLAFVSDGAEVVAAYGDGGLVRWEVEDGDILQEHPGLLRPNGLHATDRWMVVGPAERWLAVSTVSSSGRLLRVFDLPGGEVEGAVEVLELETGAHFDASDLPSRPTLTAVRHPNGTARARLGSRMAAEKPAALDLWIEPRSDGARLTLSKPATPALPGLAPAGSRCRRIHIDERDGEAVLDRSWTWDGGASESGQVDQVARRRLGGLLTGFALPLTAEVRMQVHEGVDWRVLLGALQAIDDVMGTPGQIVPTDSSPPACDPQGIDLLGMAELLSLCVTEDSELPLQAAPVDIEVSGGRVVRTSGAEGLFDSGCLSDLARWIRPVRPDQSHLGVDVSARPKDGLVRGLPADSWRRVGRSVGADLGVEEAFGLVHGDDAQRRLTRKADDREMEAEGLPVPNTHRMSELAAAAQDGTTVQPSTGDAIVLDSDAVVLLMGPGLADVLFEGPAGLTRGRLEDGAAAVVAPRVVAGVDPALAGDPPAGPAWIYYGVLNDKGGQWHGRNVTAPSRAPRDGDTIRLIGPRPAYSDPLQFDDLSGRIASQGAGAFPDGATLVVNRRQDWQGTDQNVWLLVSASSVQAASGATVEAKAVELKAQVATGQPDIIGHPEDVVSIQRTMKKYLGRVRQCYERQLKGAPSLGGKLAVGFDVAGGTGNVSGVRTEANTTGSADLAVCINKVVTRIRFNPPPAYDTEVASWPFVFSNR
jgi:hypothetical protein